jgi:hypothetical protein
MQLRRIILALTLSATVGLTAACGDDAKDTAGAASATSAAASPSVDLKANTEAVCKAVVAAYDKEKPELATVLGELLTAVAKEDKAAESAAKAKGEVIFGRLAKAVEAEVAKAADPQVKAALQTFVTTWAKTLTGNNLDDPAFEAEMDKAAAEAEKYCPALKV